MRCKINCGICFGSTNDKNKREKKFSTKEKITTTKNRCIFGYNKETREKMLKERKTKKRNEF